MQIDIRRPSPAYALLWKESRQLLSIGGPVLVGLIALQILGTALALLFTDARSTFEFFVFSASFLGPFVFIIGAVGVNIGHERQSGTWAWNSGIPVEWPHAFLFKALATIAGATIVAAILAMIPLAYSTFYPAVWRSVGTDMPTLTSIVLLNIFGLTGGCLLLTLWVREPLVALVLAAVLAILANGIVVSSWPVQGEDITSRRAARLLVFVVPVILLYFAGATALFRARWYSARTPGRRWRVWSLQTKQVAQTWQARVGRANMLVSQFTLALRHNMTWPKLCFAGLALWGSIKLSWANLHLIAFAECLIPFLFFGVFASSLAFVNDNRNGSWRFLADRGVRPATVYWSRLLPTVALVLVPLLLVLWFNISQASSSLSLLSRGDFLWVHVVAALAVVSIGFYSSVCYERPVLAFSIASMVTLIGVLWATGVVHAGEAVRVPGSLNNYWLVTHTIGWAWLCPLILLFAAWRAVRQWMMRGPGSNPVVFPLWIAAGFVAPLLAASSTAFLALPRPDAAIPIEQAIEEAMLLPAEFQLGENDELSIPLLESRLSRGAKTVDRERWLDRREEISNALRLTASGFEAAVGQEATGSKEPDLESAARVLRCREMLLSQIGTAMRAELEAGDPKIFTTLRCTAEQFQAMSAHVHPSELGMSEFAGIEPSFCSGQTAAGNQSSALDTHRRAILVADLTGQLDSKGLKIPPGPAFTQFAGHGSDPVVRALMTYPPIRWRVAREIWAGAVRFRQ